jgi:alcohol dehydrogenase (cytochrome c)
MKFRNGLIAGVAAAGVATFGFGAIAAPTTPERLRNAAAEPHNWLMTNQTYGGARYSRLSAINKTNVAGLHIVYMAAIGGAATTTNARSGSTGSEMAVPLAEDGYLYVTDAHNKIMKFDVRGGNRAIPLWRHDPQVENPSRTRGIALLNNMVIQATNDARIIAVDKESGEVIWEVSGAEEVNPGLGTDPNNRLFRGYPLTLETAGGQLMVGLGAGGAGVGWLGGFDATTGENLWRSYTIPLPGDPNFGTWPGDTWKTGRVMPWGNQTYDVDTNTIFVGTGEPSPVYDPEFRPGDNLYSASTLAIDADSGELKWFFQETPNDGWDYDSSGTRMIIPFTDADGVVHRAVHSWSRNGFFYSLDLNTGEFLQAVAEYDNINWTKGIDSKTGKPMEYVAGAGHQIYNVAGPTRGRSADDAPLVCNTWGGSPTYWPPSYDPNTGITYQTGTQGCTYQTITRITEEAFNPLGGERLGGGTSQIQVETAASLIAIDIQGGKVVNRYVRHQGIPNNRQAEVGTLLTAGGLVFTGWADGTFAAYDKDSLAELWSINIGTDMKAAPMSFSIGGKQFIAHIAGGDNFSRGRGIQEFIMPSANLVVYGL